MTVKSLVYRVELLGSHIVARHRAISRVLRRLLVYGVLVALLLLALPVNIVDLILYISFAFRHFWHFLFNIIGYSEEIKIILGF